MSDTPPRPPSQHPLSFVVARCVILALLTLSVMTLLPGEGLLPRSPAASTFE